jgi:hypothetical protein
MRGLVALGPRGKQGRTGKRQKDGPPREGPLAMLWGACSRRSVVVGACRNRPKKAPDPTGPLLSPAQREMLKGSRTLTPVLTTSRVFRVTSV